MSQSLAAVVVHVVFSTKDRRPLLVDGIRRDLHAYLATVARNGGSECHRVGGVADHVHLAVRLHRTVSVADLVGELKTSSSMWAKTRGVPDFAWQRGYGAFSVGVRDLDALVAYIDGQELHHRSRTFQDELRRMLDSYGVPYDERYIWD